MTTCPKFESNNIVVYEDIRNGVVFAGNICSHVVVYLLRVRNNAFSIFVNLVNK